MSHHNLSTENPKNLKLHNGCQFGLLCNPFGYQLSVGGLDTRQLFLTDNRQLKACVAGEPVT